MSRLLGLADELQRTRWDDCRAELSRLSLPDLLLKQVPLLGGQRSHTLDVSGNDKQFVDQYGLLFDGHPFDWVRYKHLVPVYEDQHPFLVLQAGGQTGKTGRLLVRLTTAMLRHQGGMFGYYFPDIHLPKAFSKQRLKPFWASNPELKRLVGAPTKAGKGTDNVLTRTLAEATLFLMTTKGKSSTEGLPLKGVFFDEVRRMDIGDIERAMVRYDAQIGPIDVKVSTARYPNHDIEYFFNQGNQNWLHTGCRCPEGVVLAKTYPDCIADLRKATPQLLRKAEHAHRHVAPDLGRSMAPIGKFYPAAYICPSCGDWLPDPREGWWEQHSPGQDKAHSYQMPQLLSPTYPAGRALHKAENSKDIQEVYNSMIGVGYVDERNRGVTEDELHSCINTDLQWAHLRGQKWRRQYLVNTAFGVDVQAGYMVVVIKNLAPNGKYRLQHLAIVHGPHDNDPWHSLELLMREYDARVVVIDQAPEWSAALRFAKRHRGRVFLAAYDTDGPIANTDTRDIARWGDRKQDKTQRGEAVTNRYKVQISKYKGMKWSLGLFRAGMTELPDPRQLIQRLPMQGDQMAYSAELRLGQRAPHPICREYFRSLKTIVYRNVYAGKEDHERRGQMAWVVEALGPDHFADANLYADIALSRIALPRIPRT